MKLIRCDKINFLTAIFYILLYRFIHVNLLVEFYESFGFFCNSASLEELILTNVIALLPIIFFSGKLVASNFVSILLYFFLYVPSVITLQYNFDDFLLIIPYQVVLCWVMSMAFLSNCFTLSLKNKESHKNVFALKYNIIIAFALLAVIIAVNGGNFRLVSFAEVYDLRQEKAEVVSGRAYIGYFVMWLTYFFIPFFLIVGLMQKRKVLVILSCIIAFVIYTFDGAKVAITAPLFAYFMFLALTKLSFKFFFPLMTTFSFLLTFVCVWLGETAIVLISFLFLRTLGICGYMAYAYVDFFSCHPYTYWGHVNIINSLFHNYPYQYTLGKEVAAYNHGVSVDIAMNANANFLMTDGVAAWGWLGVIVVGFVFWLLLIFLNDLSSRHNAVFACTLLFGTVQSLLNVSMFTTLLSSGLIFIIILYRYFTLSNIKCKTE